MGEKGPCILRLLQISVAEQADLSLTLTPGNKLSGDKTIVSILFAIDIASVVKLAFDSNELLRRNSFRLIAYQAVLLSILYLFLLP